MNRNSDLPRSQAYEEFLLRGRIAHKRQLRRRLILPIAALGGALVLIPLFPMLTLRPDQLGTVAAFMMIFLFVPTFITLIILYAVLVGLTYGMAKLYSKTSGMMRGTYNLTHRVNTATTALSKRVAAPVIAMSARLAWLERLVIFKAPQDAPGLVDETKDQLLRKKDHKRENK